MRQVKCNRCGYIGDESEFPKGHDFLQNEYISKCANTECDNRQSPSEASTGVSGDDQPFEFIGEVASEEAAMAERKPVITINESKAEIFGAKCAALVKDGYRLDSSDCGFLGVEYDYCASWLAIFVDTPETS